MWSLKLYKLFLFGALCRHTKFSKNLTKDLTKDLTLAAIASLNMVLLAGLSVQRS